MNETELRDRLDLLEKRQKHVLGNQVSILELIGKKRVGEIQQTNQFQHKLAKFIERTLAIIGFLSILRRF